MLSLYRMLFAVGSYIRLAYGVAPWPCNLAPFLLISTYIMLKAVTVALADVMQHFLAYLARQAVGQVVLRPS